jgi:aryl-alcohol dehydrogenase-like predicted oxidoreductase
MSIEGAGGAGAIPRRPLGRTGVDVSILAVGGSHLGDIQDPGVATRIVHEAIDAGVSFFDNAWEYHDGRSELILGEALVGRLDRVVLMTKVCGFAPITSISGRSTSASTTTIRTCTSPRAAWSRRSTRRSERARRASSASPGTRIRASIFE